jgi:hypothetical protein
LDTGAEGADNVSLSCLTDGAGVSDREPVEDMAGLAEFEIVALGCGLADDEADGLAVTISCSPFVIGIPETGPSMAGKGLGG